MTPVDAILDYLAAGQATRKALADALGIAETSVERALAHLSREDRIHSATIQHCKTGREMTVWRLTSQPNPS